jgi:hypothetical protein
MSLGGFMGQDNTISVSGFADLVSSGSVRYVLVQGGPSGGAPGGAPPPMFGGRSSAGAPPLGAAPFVGTGTSGPNAVLSAVRSTCTAVTDTSLPVAYRGVLYDCAGKAGALSRQP